MITIDNHGPLLLATNFWESEREGAGFYFLSINAGAFRLFVPRSREADLREFTTAKEVVISRGPWPEWQRPDALEVLFDDHTQSPFALNIVPEMCDRLPLDEDAGRECVFTAWTAPRRERPHKALERPAFYRRVARLPCLKPWLKERDGQ